MSAALLNLPKGRWQTRLDYSQPWAGTLTQRHGGSSLLSDVRYDFAKLKKTHAGEMSDTTGCPHYLQSGLAITDATAASLAIFAAIRRAYAIPNFFDTCARV